MADETPRNDDASGASKRSEHGDRSLDEKRKNDWLASPTDEDRSVSESNSSQLPDHGDPTTGRDDTDAMERQSRR